MSLVLYCMPALHTKEVHSAEQSPMPMTSVDSRSTGTVSVRDEAFRLHVMVISDNVRCLVGQDVRNLVPNFLLCRLVCHVR